MLINKIRLQINIIGLKGGSNCYFSQGSSSIDLVVLSSISFSQASSFAFFGKPEMKDFKVDRKFFFNTTAFLLSCQVYPYH